jgi:hypothetical protein
MGFSGWWHLDFKLLEYNKAEKMFIVHGEDGKTYFVPRGKVADAKDYQDGDRNGVISIKEAYAAEQEWCHESS